MEYIRLAEHSIIESLAKTGVTLLKGPRRAGKSYLLRKISRHYPDSEQLVLNGEDFDAANWLTKRSIAEYKQVLGNRKIFFLDEAQHIPGIGAALKLLVDGIEGVRVMATGSSSFTLPHELGEPLTGRMRTFHLFPIAFQEIPHEPLNRRALVEELLIFGSYPETLNLPSRGEKQEYLRELVSSYLFKDILQFENIRHSDKLVQLLRLVAFQIGSEVSIDELARTLQINRSTAERYLDLLCKCFVIFRLGGFSRNLRKEITKTARYGFWDNGIRNTLIANLNPIDLRNDAGALWENWAMVERMKHQHATRMLVNNYFWRTYDGQEIDLLEEREGRLFGYEFKWGLKSPRQPAAFKHAYPDSTYEIISPDGFGAFVGA